MIILTQINNSIVRSNTKEQTKILYYQYITEYK